MDARSAAVSKDVAKSPEAKFSQASFAEATTRIALDLTTLNTRVSHPINRENAQRAKTDPMFFEAAKPAYVDGGRYQALTESLSQFGQGDVLRLTQMYASEAIDNHKNPNYKSTDREKFLAGQVREIRVDQFGRSLDRIQGRYVTAVLELDNRDALNPLTAASLQGRVEGYGQVLAEMGGTDYLQQADGLISAERKKRNSGVVEEKTPEAKTSGELLGSGLPEVKLPKGIELPTDTVNSVEVPDNFQEGILEIAKSYKSRMIASRLIADRMGIAPGTEDLPSQYKTYNYPAQVNKLALESFGQRDLVARIDDFIAGRGDDISAEDLSKIIKEPTTEEFREGTLGTLKVNGALALERWEADQDISDSADASDVERSQMRIKANSLLTAVKEMEKIFVDVFPELSDSYTKSGEAAGSVINRAARARDESRKP